MKKGSHLPPESLTSAFQDRKRNKPKISLPGGAKRGHCEHAARGDTHTPNTLGAWITWGSTRKGWMQTFVATLFGKRRAPRETHPAKTSFLQVPSKHACRLQVGERGQAATGALGLKASIPEQLSAARDAQQPMHSPHILIPELKPHINTKQCSCHQQCCPGAACSLRRVKSWSRSSETLLRVQGAAGWV